MPQLQASDAPDQPTVQPDASQPAISLDAVRAKYPQYNDMSDTALVKGLHGKFYSDMPFGTFAARVGFQPKPDGPWTDFAPAPVADGPWRDFAPAKAKPFDPSQPFTVEPPARFDPAQPYPKAAPEEPVTAVDERRPV
jgi:hypothetical protein